MALAGKLVGRDGPLFVPLPYARPFPVRSRKRAHFVPPWLEEEHGRVRPSICGVIVFCLPTLLRRAASRSFALASGNFLAPVEGMEKHSTSPPRRRLG